MNFLKNILSPSVDSLVAGLSKAVAKLESHSNRKNDEVKTLNFVIERLANKANDKHLEALRAGDVAGRIKALIA